LFYSSSRLCCRLPNGCLIRRENSCSSAFSLFFLCFQYGTSRTHFFFFSLKRTIEKLFPLFSSLAAISTSDRWSIAIKNRFCLFDDASEREGFGVVIDTYGKS